MAILDDGLDAIRDLVDAGLYSVVYGTSGDAIVFTDTALGGEVSAVEDTTFTSITSDKKIQITSTMNSVSGNGNIFKESGLTLDSGATLLSRSLNAPISKNNTIEMVRISDINFSR